MSEPAERKSHLCNDCGASSPETDTNYTLISAKFGWRLSRRTDARGQLVLEWRCPRCWAKYKNARGMLETPLDGVPASRAPLQENPRGWASGDVPPSSRPGDELPPSSRVFERGDPAPPSTTRRRG